mmetsp:Transcript_2350/g.5280  ORF Transcript_2350/g.5280 Transcript_2350/m.5280 type:complete len:675 (+) Transcript_2350:463-2487(+)
MSLGAEVEAFTQTSRFHVDLDPDVKHIDLQGLNLSIGKNDLLVDAHLQLKHGTHYALIGRNGVGKSTLLRVISEKTLVGFPRNVSVQYVKQEIAGDDRTVLQTLLDSNRESSAAQQELQQLEDALADAEPSVLVSTVQHIQRSRAGQQAQVEELVAAKRSGLRGKNARLKAIAAQEAASKLKDRELTYEQASELAHAMLTELYEKVADLDIDADTARAGSILTGLGFKPDQQHLPTRCLSGGWRMRVALGAALFAGPELLLLDEPTNHLDLKSTLWLAEHLRQADDQTLVVVSHDRSFLTEVTEETITLRDKQLLYFPGNYAALMKAKQDSLAHQAKQVDKLERKQQAIQDSIDNALKAARQAGDDKRLGQVASRRKKLEDRMGMEKSASGHRFKVSKHLAGFHFTRRPPLVLDAPEKEVVLRLPAVDDLRYKGPLLQLRHVGFRYPGAEVDTLRDVVLDLDLTCRVGVVGVNGAGKSTLMGIIRGELQPTSGSVERFHRLRVGYYAQHQSDSLLDDATPLSLLIGKAASATTTGSTGSTSSSLSEQEAHDFLGGFGVAGALAVTPYGLLSGGQRCRVALALLLWEKPHLLLLDEPTNHLDHESIEALARALAAFDGGLLVASHDVSFLQEVCRQVYVVRKSDHSVRLHNGDVADYVKSVRAKLQGARIKLSSL